MSLPRRLAVWLLGAFVRFLLWCARAAGRVLHDG